MEQEPQVSPLQIPDVKLPEQLDHSVSTITNSESITYEAAHLTRILIWQIYTLSSIIVLARARRVKETATIT